MLALAPVPLVFVLLAAAPGRGEQVPLPDCQSAPRPIELHAEPASSVHTLCISPGLTTSVLFDTPLPPGAVVPGEGHPGVQVAQAERFITLLPSHEVRARERLSMTVRFRDGAAPASVTFLLLVHPARGERQVEVVRHARTVESYQQELVTWKEEVQRCQAESARLRAAQGGPEGLTALLSAGLLGVEGVTSRSLTHVVKPRPGSALNFRDAQSYRSSVRVAVELHLEGSAGMQSWVAEGVALVDAGGREVRGVRVWQSVPIASALRAQVFVEAEVMKEEAQGVFTLKLWDGSGKRTLILDGVVFPPLPETTAAP